MKFQLRLTIAILLSPALRADAQTPWHFEFAESQAGQACLANRYRQDLQPPIVRFTARVEPGPGIPPKWQKAPGWNSPSSLHSAVISISKPKPPSPSSGKPPHRPAFPAGSYFDFSAVSALSAGQIWVSGTIKPSGDACVVKSGDGGLTWSLPYRAGGVGFFGDIQMAASQTGYAAGGGLRRTSDGARHGTWIRAICPTLRKTGTASVLKVMFMDWQWWTRITFGHPAMMEPSPGLFTTTSGAAAA